MKNIYLLELDIHELCSPVFDHRIFSFFCVHFGNIPIKIFLVFQSKVFLLHRDIGYWDIFFSVDTDNKNGKQNYPLIFVGIKTVNKRVAGDGGSRFSNKQNIVRLEEKLC